MAGADERAFLELARPGHRFVLTTHVQPDADGIGSELALAALLRARGAAVRIVNADPLPATLAFLDVAGEVERYDPPAHDPALASADAIVMLDNSDPARLGALEPAVRASRARTVSIDHHPDPDPFWSLLVLRSGVSSTAEVVFGLAGAAGVTLPSAALNALYAGLVGDTGRFRFGSTSADAFAMAAQLVRAGVSPAAMFAQMEECIGGPYMKLLGRTLAGAEFLEQGRLIVLTVPRALVSELGAEGEDTSEIINESLRLRTSRVAVLFREQEDGRTKVSLRSKGAIDVNRVARRHGGGGHRNASGIVLDAPLDEARRRLLPELVELLAA
ncbi:MAG: bifunctional oligoribonuclease/PAP phosphatase NrnA [Acidobacteria bacterium]|jgi:phosphoesterase RecJ-like protein|nr:bifunctional oligoribonuclease/PAP phosphatase NrnA [Acidobacteriota bacterium]